MTMKSTAAGFQHGVSRRDILVGGLGAGACLVTSRAGAQEGKLQSRPIPHSGEQLPVIGLGTAVSFPSADEKRRDALKAVIDALIAGGGKLIDTASVYGNAETVIGDAFVSFATAAEPNVDVTPALFVTTMRYA